MILPKSMMMTMRMKKPGEMRESMIGSTKRKRLVKRLPRLKRECVNETVEDTRMRWSSTKERSRLTIEKDTMRTRLPSQGSVREARLCRTRLRNKRCFQRSRTPTCGWSSVGWERRSRRDHATNVASRGQGPQLVDG